MPRKFTNFSLPADVDHFKLQLLNFGSEFSNFCFLENNDYRFDKSIDVLAGIGSVKAIACDDEKSIDDLISFQKSNKDWIFGHAAYDLKNKIEHLASCNFDGIGFPDYFFFVPEIVVIITGSLVSVGTMDNSSGEEIFSRIKTARTDFAPFEKPVLQSRFSKKEYGSSVSKIKQHIKDGDCYELCFCQEFFASATRIDPVKVFVDLNDLSPNPFAAFYRSGNRYLMCASPERFLKKTGGDVISQPIKGTLKRSAPGTSSDALEAQALFSDEKERAENIMIVDLVRNDLSKVCRQGTVTVRDFLQIHSLPGVHQMISTIQGKVAEEITFGELLKATFPMGSMTGAPKIKSMHLIEAYEKTRRGLFSGTVGYIDPAGNFDFNVVIRSILYNADTGYLSAQAGSAITFKSNAETEYEECQAKIAAIFRCLE